MLRKGLREKMLGWGKLKRSGKSGEIVEMMVQDYRNRGRVGLNVGGRGKCVSHGYRWERNG